MGSVKVRARGATSDSEQRLRKQVRQLKELRVAQATSARPLTKGRDGLNPRCSRRPEPSRAREHLGFCFC